MQRSHYQLLKKRILEENPLIQVVVGPRQVGKTTLVSGLLNENSSNNYSCKLVLKQ